MAMATYKFDNRQNGEEIKQLQPEDKGRISSTKTDLSSQPA